jgi:DNA polymerase III epsilon subunit-like protein
VSWLTYDRGELYNSSPTGRTFYRYLCPERAIPADALAVHGPTVEFLGDKPLFAAVAAFVSSQLDIDGGLARYK